MHFYTDPVTKLAIASPCVSEERNSYGTDDYIITLCDTDSRRWLKVRCRKTQSLIEHEEEWGNIFHDMESFHLCGAMFAAIRAELDAGPPDLTALAMTFDGQVLARSTDPNDDVTPGTHYASVDDYHIPAHIETLARDELVEVSRISTFTDIVIPASASSPDPERLVFKYYQQVFDLQSTWNAIHIGAKLSDHPNIAPVRHIIVDESDRSRVVGFTAPFFPGGTLGEAMYSRSFKLKWARQLLQTVDDLHLQYGVFHYDIHLDNLVVDPETDNLILIDFGCAAKIGTPSFSCHHQAALSPKPARNPLAGIIHDVRSAAHCVFRLATGNTDIRAFVDSNVKDAGCWVQHPDVRLDSPIADYHRLLVDWLCERNKAARFTQHDQASEPLNYPDYMPPPQVDIDAYQKREARKRNPPSPGRFSCRCSFICQCHPPAPPLPFRQLHIGDEELLEDLAPGGEMGVQDDSWLREAANSPCATSGRHFLRIHAINAGRTVLNWERPLTVHLDRTRRLLANGKYEDALVAAAANTANTATQKKAAKNKRKCETSVEAEAEAEVEEREDHNHDVGGQTTGGGAPTHNITKPITRSATKKAKLATLPTPERKLELEEKTKPARKAVASKKAAETKRTVERTRRRGAPKGK